MPQKTVNNNAIMANIRYEMKDKDKNVKHFILHYTNRDVRLHFNLAKLI